MTITTNTHPDHRQRIEAILESELDAHARLCAAILTCVRPDDGPMTLGDLARLASLSEVDARVALTQLASSRFGALCEEVAR